MTLPLSPNSGEIEDSTPRDIETALETNLQAQSTGQSQNNVKFSQLSENDTKLLFHHVLGFTSPNVQHLNDDEQIVYQSGQHIAQYNYENRTHKFVLKSSKIEKIWAFAVSKNGKFIALSEQLGNDDFQLSVYSFRTATRIRSLELKEKSPVISLDFSADSRYLAAITKEPDQSIYLFHLEKHRMLAHAQSKMPIRKVSVNPHAWHQICTIGPDICNIWRFSEKELKPIDPLGEDSTKYTFTCQAWFDDEKLLVGTEEGKILIICGQEVKSIIGDTIESQIHANSASIYCIQTVERGFVCGGAFGCFSVFERTYDQKYFSQYKQFQTVERKSILDMCVSKKEENVILLCENNEMLYFNLANVDILKLEENNFTLLPIGFHGDICTGADTCLQKSLIASVSNDRCLRIWNYVKREIQFHKEFTEDICSVALHPNGMTILIGFRYKLCLFNILHDDLYKCCEWYFKSCKSVKFSNGGHLFAAASTTSVLIISTYSFKTVANLRGHTGMVRDLHWSHDDRFLATAGYEGALYEWDIYNQEKPRIQDCIEKQATFQACVYDDESHILAGIGGVDGKVYCFTEDELRRVPVGTQLTTMCLSSLSKTLFVGTADGRVLLYNWPVDDIQFREYQIHTKSVTQFILSKDERFLMSIGGDGSLFMLDVEAVVESRTIQKKEFEHLEKFDDLTTVHRSKLLEHENELKSMRERVLQIKSDADRRIQQVLEEKNMLLDQQSRDSAKQIERLKTTIENLKNKMNDTESKFKKRIEEMEKNHLKSADEIDTLYKQAIEFEKKKHYAMSQNKDEIISSYMDKIATIQKDFEAEKEHIKQRFAADKMNQIRSFNELGQTYEETTKAYQETLDQNSEDHKQQLDSMQHKLNDQESREQKLLRQARTKEAMAKTELDSMRNIIQSHQDKINFLSSEVDKARKTIEITKDERLSLENDYESAKETIALHEKTITDLKKQVKEMEKLRFILSFKLNKAKDDVNPKEMMIQEMREKLVAMESELVHMQKENERKSQIQKDQKEKLDSLNKVIMNTQHQLDEKSREMQNILEEISELSHSDPKTVEKRLRKLLSNNRGKYINRDSSSMNRQLGEFERQRDHLQQQMIDLRRNLNKKEVHMKKDVSRKTGENSILVSEINSLRKETHEYKQKISMLEQKLRLAQQEINHTQELVSSTNVGNSNLPSTGGSRRASFGLSRVRTPDSVYSSKPNSQKSQRAAGGRPSSGRLVRGNTWSRESLDRNQLRDVLVQMEKTQSAYQQQQRELSQLQDYVSNITNHLQEENEHPSSIPTPPRIITPRIQQEYENY